MPFKSEKQRKWMHTNEPDMAKKWEKEEESVEEAKKRDYKAEYKKYGKSKKAKKYRAELNKYNRQKGTYGNGDKKDASHKGGKIVGFEEQSKNRGRREKSRLKKEQKLTKEKLIEIIKDVIKEDFAGAYPEHKREKFDNKRRKQSEVLGYKLTGKNDVRTEIDDATVKEGKLTEAISGSDRKIMMMIVRDIIENLKKAGAKKPSDAVGRGVLSILRAMTYSKDNANYKNYKKYFPRTFNSKLTQKRVK